MPTSSTDRSKDESTLQQTVASPAVVSGISLMLGVEATMRVCPAAPNTGIAFQRVDQPARPTVAVVPENLVSDLGRSTGVRAGEASVQTIEHVMSALAGVGIDNALIEIDAPEPPIGDGSASPLVDAIIDAGIATQAVPRRRLRLSEPIHVEHGDRRIDLIPSDRLRVTFVFDNYGRAGVQTQIATFDITPETYQREIAPARTFCFEDEVAALRSAGLGKGADDSNVLVIDESGQPGGGHAFRFQDEMVRHKVLDLIGDLYTAGSLPLAHIIAVRSQHALNLQLSRQLAELCRQQQEIRVSELEPPLDLTQIEGILPHRAPFLFIDRVVQIEGERRIVAVKNVTGNEDFFRGHFPGRPIMPGVLIVEALAQAGGVLLMRSPTFAGKLALFMTIEDAKFRRPVTPGDQLRLEVEALRVRARVGRLRGAAYVGDTLAAEATFSFAIADRDAVG